MKTFRSMRASGEVKRGEASAIRPQDLHEEPGFNLRDLDGIDEDGLTFQEGIDELTAYIKAGGVYPPLEVRPREEGGVWVVDGHRRRLAILQAIAEGAGIEWVNVTPFTGNDADRTLRIVTSARRANLSPVEVARGYKRLIGYGWSVDRIATEAVKSRSHVEQLLILADAPSAVQRQVLAREVSVSVAIDMVRKLGEGASDVLADKLVEAKASGKTKVTPGVMKGKPLPPKVAARAIGSLDEFMGNLPKPARERLAGLELQQQQGQPVDRHEVSVPATLLLALLAAHQTVAEARAAQEKKTREKAAEASQQPIE